MAVTKHSRRDFIKTSGIVTGSSWLAANMPLVVSASQLAAENRQAEAAFENISLEESTELSAWVDQIIPQDETAGATEMGVVYFIDVALGGFMSGAAPMLRQGLEEFQKKVKSAYPDISRFSDLSFENQTVMLKSVEETPLFGMLYFMTMCGAFCLPSYGGNRGNAGWDLVGFDHRHAWLPPFGYYDAAVHGQVSAQGDDHEQV